LSQECDRQSCKCQNYNEAEDDYPSSWENDEEIYFEDSNVEMFQENNNVDQIVQTVPDNDFHLETDQENYCYVEQSSNELENVYYVEQNLESGEQNYYYDDQNVYYIEQNVESSQENVYYVDQHLEGCQENVYYDGQIVEANSENVYYINQNDEAFEENGFYEDQNASEENVFYEDQNVESFYENVYYDDQNEETIPENDYYIDRDDETLQENDQYVDQNVKLKHDSEKPEKEISSRSNLLHSANAWSDVGYNFDSSVDLFRRRDRFRPTTKSTKSFDKRSKCASDSNLQDAMEMMEPGLRKIRKDSYATTATTTATSSSVENYFESQNQIEPVYQVIDDQGKGTSDEQVYAFLEDSGNPVGDESGFFSWQPVTKIAVNRFPGDDDSSDSSGIVTVNGRRFESDADLRHAFRRNGDYQQIKFENKEEKNQIDFDENEERTKWKDVSTQISDVSLTTVDPQ
jgi:hypothetical protein